MDAYGLKEALGKRKKEEESIGEKAGSRRT
jgi:hypothetical protein